MFELNGYLHDLISRCQASFGERLMYVGLQGSIAAFLAKNNRPAAAKAVERAYKEAWKKNRGQ